VSPEEVKRAGREATVDHWAQNPVEKVDAEKEAAAAIRKAREDETARLAEAREETPFGEKIAIEAKKNGRRDRQEKNAPKPDGGQCGATACLQLAEYLHADADPANLVAMIASPLQPGQVKAAARETRVALDEAAAAASCGVHGLQRVLEILHTLQAECWDPLGAEHGAVGSIATYEEKIERYKDECVRIKRMSLIGVELPPPARRARGR